jgi:branched-chain amino acid transport system permease protein
MPFPGAKRWLFVGIVLSIVASYLAPQFNRYYLGVWTDVGIAIILATSLNLINGYTGQFSLGHAGFMAVGGYFSAWLSLKAGSAMVGEFWFFPLALIAGGLFAAAVGFLVGVPSLRLRGDYLAIVTLGFGEIIRVIAQNTQAVGAASGLKGIPKLTTLGWTFGLAAVTIYAVTALVNSTYGRGFVAVSDDEIAAESNGVNTTRTKVTAFVTGAFFAGIAGGLYAHHKQFLSPVGFGWLKSIDIVVMVILGGALGELIEGTLRIFCGRVPLKGLWSTLGIVSSATLLTWLPELLREFSEYRMIVYALLIILLMLLSPAWLFSRIKLRRETKLS